ncbi:MAG: metallophosphoesterase [Clostridiales bacterium]|nr:metallophosphoesterase [Clostridiales bacterium]
MKILIVSDTHGREKNLETVLEKTGPIDRLIHLGDVEDGEEYIRTLTEAPITMVAGNNDYFTDLPNEEIIQLGRYRALVTHGHYYYVSIEKERLREEARSRGVDIVMYGHTHRPYLEQKPGLTVLNPGSLTLPRQEGHKPSYMIMEIDGKGTAHYTICYL